MKSWYTDDGAPFPFGVSWIEEEQAYNFAIYSKFAESVTLLVYSDRDFVQPLLTRSLDYLRNKSWHIWHCRIPGADMAGAHYYAYRIGGPPPQGRFQWHAFDPDKVLLDPYAKSVFFPPHFDRQAAIHSGPNDGNAPLGLLDGTHRDFDWQDDRHPHHESDTIIYEMHVRGFTQSPTSGVAPEHRGTFAGVIEKIPYLQQLGITVVELMPVFQFDPQEENYWGYMPLNFFSPHHRYASRPEGDGPHEEFREMVKALHDAGIAVILDVVYNHTCEGNQNGPTYSFKGIDNSTYYAASGNPRSPYENFSGTGNALNFGHRNVRRMVVESMRYWVKEMHVDGFRFDLASVFSRNEDGSPNFEDPPIFGDIVSDPDLSHIRLIAEPWDAAGLYQLGRGFPAVRWYQWNGRFRDEMRRYVRGDAALVGTAMSRLYGSDDLFPDDLANSYHPFQSINYLASHDGFTLYDLVAYNQKHNEANGHSNTDGPNDNYSWNCGWEGDQGASAEVLALRKQQVKNFCCVLMLSNGTPMLRAGDEFMRTQRGNNNPYNQDNEITWLDWNRLTEHGDVFRFFQRMIAFRKAHPSLSRSRFWRGDIDWYGTSGDVDFSYGSHAFAFCLCGERLGDKDIYAMFNMGTDEKVFTIEQGDYPRWHRVVDTSLPSPDDICDPGSEQPLQAQQYHVAPRSIVVLLGQ